MERLQPLRIKGRYVNPGPDGPVHQVDEGESDLKKFLEWRRTRKPHPASFDVPRVEVPGDVPGPAREGIAATWIGHSSTLLQMDGRSYLIDPVWSSRLAGVVKRYTAPGLPWEALPAIDALVLSHNHYDHMDAATLKRLPRETPVFCPTGVGKWLRKRGFTRVTEQGWWEAAELDGHRVTCVPAQHFSGRTPFDRDASLWGGFVLDGDRGSRAYYMGDSGYTRAFRQIGHHFPGIDLALVPVGAYEPRWFMAAVHVDPAEAGQAFLDLGARHMLPVHWGAFRLADEAIDEPPRVLRAWWAGNGLPSGRLLVPALGERVVVPSRAPPLAGPTVAGGEEMARG